MVSRLGKCRSFPNGLHHEWGEFVKEKPGLMQFCTPDGVTVIQAVRILINYLSEHPDQLH
jgi:Rap1a immunity proteins